MYRLTEIQEALQHLVGFEQDYNPLNQIKDALTQTESGLYFQSAHPMVTLEVIKQNMPNEFILGYPEWVEGTPYGLGAKVRYNGNLYESRTNNNTTIPTSGTWSKIDYFSEYLEKEVRNGIGSMVQRFVREKGANKLAPDLLTRRTFFDGEGYIYDTVPNGGKIAGFEIIPRRSMGVSTKIERIGLQMRGGSGDVTLYLFHSSKIEPIAQETVYVNGNGGFEWFTMYDWYMPYLGENNAGGSWYVVYDQNALPEGMHAINVGKDFSRSPVTSSCCGNANKFRRQQQFSENLEFYPFTNDAGLPTEEMWDVTRNIYPGCINYGMNIELTVGCDITDFIISQRNIFATVLQKQVAANFLKRYTFNPDSRVNISQLKIAREQVTYELDGNTVFAKELAQEYAALDINTRGIDKVCLPCNNRGIRYTNA